MGPRSAAASSPTTPRMPSRSRAAPRPLSSRSSAFPVAPRWCTATTWWWGRPDPQLRKIICAGFRPEGRVRQPGADASPPMGYCAKGCNREQRHLVPWFPTIFRKICETGEKAISRRNSRAADKKEDPGSRRARVCRRMGEGLGAGGHATRRWINNATVDEWFLAAEIIFELWPARPAAGGATASHRPAGRRGGHPEIPNSANGYEDARHPHRGPRSRSGCRQETGWEDARLGKP